jgi:DNA-binding transcriptional ArsR family regulator
MAADNLVILEPGDERAQKIAKAMASRTATDILRLLADGQKSMTEITDQLAIPLNTAKYHFENLLDAGLISVAETKYSVKGREVKIYTLSNQLLIVAPRQSNVHALLLKYAALFAVVIFGTIAVAIVSPLLLNGGGMSPDSFTQITVPAAAPRGAGGFAKSMNELANPAGAASPDIALAFLLGGLLVIAALLIYEAYLWKKR